MDMDGTHSQDRGQPARANSAEQERDSSALRCEL